VTFAYCVALDRNASSLRYTFILGGVLIFGHDVQLKMHVNVPTISMIRPQIKLREAKNRRPDHFAQSILGEIAFTDMSNTNRCQSHVRETNTNSQT
jgi:hypothetical protein